MEEKIAIITGANSGIGKATAIGLAKKGIHIIMMCRSQARGQEALKEVIKQSGGKVTLILGDLADLTSVKQFSESFKQQFSRLDILVNNAGVISKKRQETKDGFELQFGVNHLGHFLLTHLLLPLICATPNSRIINVSSMAYRFGKLDFNDLAMEKSYSSAASYSRSKLCNVLFTKELANRLKGTSTTTNSLHPGAVATNILASNNPVRQKFPWIESIAKTPEKGAETSIYLAISEEVSNISGAYFSNCKMKKTTTRSNDPRLAQELWTISEQLIGDYL